MVANYSSNIHLGNPCHILQFYKRTQFANKTVRLVQQYLKQLTENICEGVILLH